MIVFGIDPGSHKTGWGVVQIDGNSMVSLGHGVIRANAEAALAVRLEVLFAGLREALTAHPPDRVCLESIFHHENARSALVLGHARGVALLAARMAGVPIDEISPAEVKKAVTGSGRADKKQVQEMIRVLLGLRTTAPTDASDALAVAIAGTSRARARLATIIDGRPT